MLKLSLNHLKLCIRSSTHSSFSKNSLINLSAYRFSDKTTETKPEDPLRTPITRYNSIIEQRNLPIDKQETIKYLGIYSAATALSFSTLPIWITICPMYFTFIKALRLAMIYWNQSRDSRIEKGEITLSDTLYIKTAKLILLADAGALFYISSLASASTFPEIALLPQVLAMMRTFLGLGLLTSIFDNDNDFIKNEMEDAVFLKNKIYKYSSPTILSNDPDSQFFIWLKNNNPTKLDYITPILTALSAYGIYEYDYKDMGIIAGYVVYTMLENRYKVWQRNKEWKDPFVSKILLEDGGHIKVYAMNDDVPLLCDIGKTRILESDAKEFDEKRVGQNVMRVEFFEIETKRYNIMNVYLENRTSTVENIPLLDDILRGDATEVAKYKLVDADEVKAA